MALDTSILFPILKKQGYHIVGSHSAVKRCKWYKESMLGRGACYKSKFYGINSHQCMQSTPCLQYCTQGCVFCWRVQGRDREEKYSKIGREIGFAASRHNELPKKNMAWDSPEHILDGIVKEQLGFAEGYNGHPGATKEKVMEARNPRLLTLSLAGEPTLYSYLPELIRLAGNKGFLTFLVTNGTSPSMLKKLIAKKSLPTQLYISMDAPDKESYLKTCNPCSPSLWAKYLESLKVMKKLKGNTRAVLRMTLVRRHNDGNLEGYADQIKEAEPDYVEVKSFVFVGGSRSENRGLKLEDMLKMDEIRGIGKKLAKLTGYTLTDEHEPSRVVLLVRDQTAETKRILKY